MSPQILLRTPLPYSDESLASYLIRLAQSNYYDSPNWILQLAQLKTERAIHFPNNNKEPSLLSQLIGVSDQKLKAMADGGIIKDDTFNYTIYNFATKLCPQCLKEYSYCPTIWDYNLVKVCPFHQCHLIEECPQCKKAIKWARPSINQCKCSFDFRDSKPAIARSTQTILSLYFYGKKGYTTCLKNRQKLYGINHPIFDLNIEDFVDLLDLFFDRNISLIMLNFDPKNSKFSRNKTNRSEIYDRGEVAFSFLRNWQLNLTEFLKLYKIKTPSRFLTLSRFQSLVAFLAKLGHYFSQSDDFTEYICLHILNLLEEFSIEKIEVIWNEDTPKIIESFKLEDYTLLLVKTAQKINLFKINLAQLIYSSQAIDWLFPNYHSRVKQGTMIITEPQYLLSAARTAAYL